VTPPLTVNKESTVRNQKKTFFVLDVKVPFFAHYVGTSESFEIAGINNTMYAKLYW